MDTPHLQQQDPTVFDILIKETNRQKEGLELIPSENYVSPAVLEAMGTIFTNKYSEGYPGKRYYGGQEFIDQIELLAIERAKRLFPAEHVNVQPYSGSPANSAIYFALLNYGDTAMGLKLDHGGHITHGLPIGFSGKSYNFIPYLVNVETGLIDMEEVRKIAHEVKPKMIVCGYTAYPRTIDFKGFYDIAQEVGAILMADISHIAGLIIGEVHPSPFPYADVVMTTTHKTLRGPRGAMIMCKEKFAKDIDRAVFPGMQGGPHEHTIAAKAVAFEEAARPDFKTYAAQIVKNAKALADELLSHGFELVSGGTDNHLILIDLTNKNVTGKEMQSACDIVGISLNKNTVPGEKRSPFDPSGVRLGTPAITTRGMKEKEMVVIAKWIKETAENVKNEEALQKIKQEIIEFSLQFPVPGIG
jgi:glycine hydroxymethyltransferase